MTNNEDKKANGEKKQGFRLYAQFVLIGAALGAYYGVFYRNPERAVDFSPVVLLSLLSAVVVTIIQIWKKGYPAKEKLMIFLKSFGMFFLFLTMLEARPLFEQWGGKGLVIAFTTLVGATIGFIMGLKKKPVAGKATEIKK
ncbi:MAG TPA: hypothetical protein DD636_01785 [Anaerolineaceae bacterium]|jgi:hypothetical protein|nr:hypothetical protein [Anaerolineaceae bacterium]